MYAYTFILHLLLMHSPLSHLFLYTERKKMNFPFIIFLQNALCTRIQLFMGHIFLKP